MARSSRANRIDANQNEVVNQLRSIGASVAITSSLGNGFVDIVVGFRKVNYLFEIKDANKPPSQRKLTPSEKEWHLKWSGNSHVVTCLDDCLEIFRNST